MAEGIDYKAMAAEYREMGVGYQSTIKTLNTTIEGLTTTIEGLQGTVTGLEDKVTELVDQLIVAKGGGYISADMDTLFDEMIDGLNDYIFTAVPESIRTEIENRGDKVTIETAFGPERLAETFSTTYTRALKPGYQLYATPSTDDAVVTLCSEGITEQTINDTKAWVEKKLNAYKAKEAKLKRPNSTRHKGAYGVTMTKWSEQEALWADVEAATAKDNESYQFALTRYESMGTVRDRVNAYLQACGYFLLYTSLRGIKMSEVDARTVVQFQDFIKDNVGSAPETLGKFASICKLYFTWLASDKYMAEIPEKGKKSIPPRRYETGASSRKPHPAFGLTIKEDQGRRITIDPVECELCKVYGCIRKITATTDENLAREPMLIEICLRIQQETGLRRRFLLNLRWEDFSEKPVMKMPGGETIYKLDLERIRDAVHRNKLVPEKDMYISGILGRMINAYPKRAGICDVLRPHFPIFNERLLLGPHGKRTYAKTIDESLWRRMIQLPLEAKCGTGMGFKKFRNTYYTVMLAALERGDVQPGQEVSDPKSFALWTGDTVTTARKNYKAKEGVINLPDSYIGKLEYKEIVTKIFGIHKIWDAHTHKWK